MTDKKTFGSFIKLKRTEKNYSQKDLAEMLFVTEGAISKWERGVSYPDITLIADICRVLDISEHELITASNDTNTKRMKDEARKFRAIRGAWFWLPTISYGIALLTCFICNLAVNHTLSWFFIVLSALICAYTFIPTLVGFFASKKLLVFSLSTYLSICLLLFTCAVYTNGLSWFLTACIGILIGYELVFVPIFLSNTCISRFKFMISFAAACVLTVLLLVNVHVWNPFKLLPAVLLVCYAFIPPIVCTLICAFRFDAFLKAGICTAFCTVMYSFINYVVDTLFGIPRTRYDVDFSNWEQCTNENVNFIVLLSLLSVSVVLIGIGIFRICKKHNR